MTAKVAIIGSGPAGSSAAILLAKAGHSVYLFERDQHPRYHIGESGILTLPTLLNLLGVEQRVEALGALKKGGVFFDWNEKWWINWGEKGQYTYHVIRSEFDHLLAKRACECGATLIEQAKVDQIFFEGEKATSLSYVKEGKKQQLAFDYLIDASGRAALLARKYLHSQTPLKAFQNVALWGYWHKAQSIHALKSMHQHMGYSPLIDHPITLSAIPHGWIWGIPLHNQTMSVGVVLEQSYFNARKQQKSSKEIYIESLKQSETFTELLKPALFVSQVQKTQDWSYYTQKWSQENFFLVGDAAVFIDPLLSTGMTSAMLSSVNAAACLLELEKKELDPQEIHDFYKEDYQKRFWRLSFIIGALYGAKAYPEDLFYQTHQLTSLDLNGSSFEEIKSSFSSVIAGLEDLKEVTSSELQQIASQRIIEAFNEDPSKLPFLPDLNPHSLQLQLHPLSLLRGKLLKSQV